MSFKSFYDGVKDLAILPSEQLSAKELNTQRYTPIATSSLQTAKQMVSRKEVAALLGQASDATAPLHYGRKQQGRKGATK